MLSYGELGGIQMRGVKFVLVICLLAIAVMAVLSVTYPELQQPFRDFFGGVWTYIGNLFDVFFGPLKEALRPG